MQLMTVSQYADHKGVSRPAVDSAIRDGRILIEKVTPRGKKQKTVWLNVEECDIKWAQNSDSTFLRQKTKGEKQGKEVELGGSVDTASETLQKSRAMRERFAALSGKIDYEKQIGKLVDAEKCNAIVFGMAQTVKQNILNIPDRISAMLASESDPRKINDMLTHELRVALQEIADGKIF
jgi:hypothetical protein